MTIPDQKLIPGIAILAGTVDAIDRSRQYQEPNPKDMLRAINEGWAKTRENEKAIRQKDIQIAELKKKFCFCKIKNVALISIISGLALKGLEALLPLVPNAFSYLK
jgi:hypothetical protein